MELNLLAEFVDRLHDDKRDMLQLTAISARLFYKGLRDMLSDAEMEVINGLLVDSSKTDNEDE